MIKLFFILSFILFNSCGPESDETRIEEKQSKKEEKEIKTQEKAKFKSLAECVKSRSGGKKPTAEMLKQCLSN